MSLSLVLELISFVGLEEPSVGLVDFKVFGCGFVGILAVCCV